MNIQFNTEKKKLDDLKTENIPSGLKGYFPTYIKRGLNSEIWDVSDNRYIDFSGGIAVQNVGHSHPYLLNKVQEQLQSFQHSCFAVIPYSNYINLAAKMNKLIPGDYKKKTFFLNSGAEAVENAIKIARYNRGVPGVIAFKGAFHGRTDLGLNLTGKIGPYKQGFLAGGHCIYHLPFPAKALGVDAKDSLRILNDLFTTTIEPSQIAAIIIEPVQGEGGFYQAPVELLWELRSICNKYGIILIIDEVQSGFGRTGKFFALEHYQHQGKQIEADIVTYAKSLAGGFPLSGISCRAELVDNIHGGGLGTTFGGNPISIAAALAVIDIIEQEDLLHQANHLGEKIKHAVQKVADQQPLIAEVRGIGSMVAIEFQDKSGKVDPKKLVADIQKTAFDKGLLLLTCGINGNVIRLLYPLTISDAVVEEGLSIMIESINQAISNYT